MKITVMRKMDFYLGVPLTFLCSVLLKAKRVFLPHRKIFPADVHSILLIELSEMGSMIQLMPVLDKIKRTYPQARIYFVTFKSSAPILQVLKIMDAKNIWTLDTKNIFCFSWGTLRLLFKLMTTKFDLAFDFELFSRISSLISFCSGATIKTGFGNFTGEGLYRGNFLTHPVTYNPHVPISKNFISMHYSLSEHWDALPHCKLPIPDTDIKLPDFTMDTAVIDAFRTRLYTAFPLLNKAAKLIIINPNSSEALPLRRWPVAYYISLIEKLTSHAGVEVVITGNASESADAHHITNALPHLRITDLSGFTNMEEVIALYYIADLMVTNDSGPAQFSALAKLNTITFFGPETPDLYGSLNPNAYNFFKRLHCSPCYTAQNNRISQCTNNVCMQSIEVNEVYAKAKQMLGFEG